MPSTDCDVCGLPDIYDGQGDGIGSCECPRCDGGEAAADSVLCICPPGDADDYFDGDASMADVIPEDWRGEAMT